MLGLFSRRKANVTRIAAPRGAVPRLTASLMDQRGWKKTSAGWTGPYATRHHGTWLGNIEKAGGTLRVFIHNPPPSMRAHPKWACFHNHVGGWWRIHLHTNPVDGDPNAVIRYVEQILTESFKL